MSVTDFSAPVPPKTRAATSNATALATVGWWSRVGLACAVLVGSGFVRSKQAERIQGQIDRSLTESFALESIPNTLGDWQGEPTEIDEQIVRLSGARDVVTRRYVNRNTGVAIDMILLFGTAVDMYGHTPEVCYPAAGYTLVSSPELRRVQTPSGDASFRTLVYAKGEGAAARLQEVNYTWRHNGRWSPELANYKLLERIPGMYKVHIARHTTGRERREIGNPSEAFLRALLPEMERRMKAVGPSHS
jgi:Protein of unknown function (DUF3485)